MPTEPTLPLLDVEPLPPLADAAPAEIAEHLRERGVRFLRLYHSDLRGTLSLGEVPVRRAEEVLRDGLPIERTLREGLGIDETALRLRPDLATLHLLPYLEGPRPSAAVLCDLQRADGTPYEGDPRHCLRRVTEALAADGWRLRIAAEVEFFLLQPLVPPSPTPRLPGCQAAETARLAIVEALEAIGLEVDALSDGDAPGQHRLRLAAADALAAADQLALFRTTAREVAERHGLLLTLMPKPFAARHGCGLHLHHALYRGEANVFWDAALPDALPEVLRAYVGGLLRHARGYTVVTNPLVNSYKRLVPGFAAPVAVAWGMQNHSALVRVPTPRGPASGCEVRLADAAANAYLAIAVQAAAGLDGVRRELEPGEPVNKPVGSMSPREQRRLGVERLPRGLGEALPLLDEARLIRATLGEYLYAQFREQRRAEWRDYRDQVHAWELEQYLAG